eukprot:403347960
METDIATIHQESQINDLTMVNLQSSSNSQETLGNKQLRTSTQNRSISDYEFSNPENICVESVFIPFHENSIHQFQLLNQSSKILVVEKKDAFIKKITIQNLQGKRNFKEILIPRTDQVEEVLIFGNDQYIALQSMRKGSIKVYINNLKQLFDDYSQINTYLVQEQELKSLRKNYLRKFNHPTAQKIKLFTDEYILFYSDNTIDVQSWKHLMSYQLDETVKVSFQIEEIEEQDQKKQKNKKLSWKKRAFASQWLFGLIFNQKFQIINMHDSKLYLGFENFVAIFSINIEQQTWNSTLIMQNRCEFIQNSDINYKLKDENKIITILQVNSVTKQNQQISIQGLNNRYNSVNQSKLAPLVLDGIIYYAVEDEINKSIELIMIDTNTLHIINKITVDSIIKNIDICKTTKQIYISLEQEVKVIKPIFSSFFPQNYVKIPPRGFFQRISNEKIVFKNNYSREIQMVNPKRQDKIDLILIGSEDKKSNKNRAEQYQQFQFFNNNREVIFIAKNSVLKQGTYVQQVSPFKSGVPLMIDSQFAMKIYSVHYLSNSKIYCLRGTMIDLISYSYETKETSVKTILQLDDILKQYVLLFQMKSDSLIYAFIDYKNRKGRCSSIYQIKDEKSSLYCEIEDVWTYTFNNNYEIMFIFTNFRKLVAYDLVKKQYISSFYAEIPKIIGLSVDLSYNNDKNILAVVMGKELMIKMFYLDVNQNQELSIIHSICLNFKQDGHNCQVDRAVRDEEYRKARYLQFYSKIKQDDYQSRSLLSIDYFIEEQNANYPFLVEPFYKNGLLEQNILFDSVEVNMFTQTYNLFSDIDNQPIGFIQQLQTTDDFQRFQRLVHISDLDIINELKQNPNRLNMYLMYYQKVGNLFNIVAKRARVIQYLASVLAIKQKSEIPILMLISNKKSPLDVAINANDIKSVIALLEIVVKFQNNHVFNYLVDKNLISLIEMQINLNDYFESNLPVTKINNQTFPDLHVDDQTLILAVPLIQNPIEILEKYDEIFEGLLKQHTFNEHEKLTSIEYFLINLPVTLTKEPKKLMQVLSKSENIEIFEYLAVQAIIDFKWYQYTKQFFQKQFFIFLVFCFTYIFEVLYTLINVNRRENPIVDDRNPIVLYTFKAVSLIVLSYFIVYEIKQSRKQKGYLWEIWNFFDYSLIISYLTEIILEIVIQNNDAVVVIKVIIVALIFLKICFFLRIYNGFNFLVSMMSAVIIDLKYFVAFFVICIFQFGLIFVILFDAIEVEEYNGIHIFAYFVMAFRTSLGDFNVDSYKDQSQPLAIISWIIWIIAVMILNVMFMNFIIAVISESYEKVMQKLTAESYRVKVQMIVERELHFTDEQLLLNSLFPQYLLLRRPVTSNIDPKDDWQGFVKDLKYQIKVVSSRLRADLKQNLESIDKQVIDSNSRISEINYRLLDQDKQIQQIGSSLKLFIEEQRAKDNSIKELNATIAELVKKLN